MALQKGQSSAEYIVILAVTIVIAFFAVGLASQVLGTGTDTRISQSEQYWGGAVSPFRLNAFSLSYKNVSGYAESNLSIVFMNPTKRSLTIKNVTIRPGTFWYAYYSDGTYIGNSTMLSEMLFPGDARTIIFKNQETGSSAWVPGRIYELKLNITYDSEIPGQMQVGREPLIGQTAFQ